MVLFKIGLTDITPYMDTQNYVMNEADVYTEWTDGNGKRHRDAYRTQVSGSFRLGFKTAAAFQSFNSLLDANRQLGGYYPVTAYVNNTGETNDYDVYLTITNTTKRDELNGRVWYQSSVTVEER
ncbi:MAG: hypothetical protein IJ110_01435 [Lachnospiraceae bacterium]|nr:hypothetical protein [Lachnospiraceae bacterium]